MKKFLVTGYATMLLCIGLPLQILAQTGERAADIVDEFVGPFPSWLNAKTGFGAKGDGIADDTQALQAALDAAASSSSATTLFLPPGTYRITRTLALNYRINVSVIGADPATTAIRWAGPRHGTMLRLNGTAYSRFNRLTWDGAGTADIAVDQSWDGAHPHFDTANELADDVFTDTGFGIRGGALGHGFAETSILRDRFIRNSQAGVSLGNFNALDIWIRDCLFQDCATGVTNTLGAGNFKIYHCTFLGSTKCDISMGNTGEFSIRNNTSLRSAQFFNAGFTRNPASIILEGNIILDPLGAEAISVSNQGAVIFLRNTVRSSAEAAGPVARFSSNAFCLNNTFTLPAPIAAGDHSTVTGTQVVALAQLVGLAPAKQPGAQRNMGRKIFEVPPGATAAAIQAVIDRAAKLSGRRPIVHFPYANYQISATLVVPAGSDMQLTGDGFGDVRATMLSWTGTSGGPIIRFEGPSRATLRDLTLKGSNSATNLLITGADAPGSRVFLEGFHQVGGGTGLHVNGLDHTLVLAYDGGFSGLQTAVKVIGGPAAAAGHPAEGRTVLYSGAMSGNVLSHQLSGGATLTVQDGWYEGGNASTYAELTGSGRFTAAGDHIAVPQNSPAFRVHDFSGKALLAASDLSGRFTLSGSNAGARVLILGILAENEQFLDDQSRSNAQLLVMTYRTRNHGSTVINGGSLAAGDIGTYQEGWVKDMLNVQSSPISSSPRASDIRLYRVMSLGGAIGLDIEAR
jgi:hypothetical protein